MEKLVMNIGPEFLKDDAHTIVQHLASPSLEYFVGVAFLDRVVTAGNYSGHTAANNLRKIKPCRTRVTSGDQQAT
jgi:hypothetical protein